MLPGIKLFDLSGRVAMITGGSKGLGAAIASGLASAGANLVLVSRHEDELQATASELRSDFGVEIICREGDVTDMLVKAGIDGSGQSTLFDGRTGEALDNPLALRRVRHFRVKLQAIETTLFVSNPGDRRALG